MPKPHEFKHSFGYKFAHFGADAVGMDLKAFGDTTGKYFMWDASANKAIVLGDLELTGTPTITGNLGLTGTLTVGVDDTGYDVKFFGATTGKYFLWDESADKVIILGDYDITGNSQFTGTITVGVDDTGHDVKFFGATTGTYFLWDESADKCIIAGSLTVSSGIESFGAITTTGTITVGIDDTGYDVKFFGATSGKSWLWDESADKMIITGDSQFTGVVTVGVDDTGHDVQLFGATAGAHLLWDESADTLKLVGGAKTDLQGTLTVGVDDTGYDVKLFGATAGSYLLWDESADKLIINAGTADLGTSCEADAYTVGGVAGADFNGAVTNLTVVKGIVTAAS